MGTSGVPWNVPKSTIIGTLRLNKGRLTPASKALNCHYCTLKKHIEGDEELKNLLKELRNEHKEEMVFGAEDVIEYAMGQSTSDLTNALKAATFVLNSRGREYDWVHAMVAQAELMAKAGDAKALEILKAFKDMRNSLESDAPKPAE